MKLSQLQLDILNNPAPKIVVNASAAAGKTALLTEKVRQILRSGVDPRQVAAITFTNMAAAEMKKRLGEDFKEGLFIGTIHSLANYFLNRSGIDTSKMIETENFDEFFEVIQKHPQCVSQLEWILLDEAQDSDNLQFHFLFDLINPTHFFVCGDVRQSIYRWKGSRPDLLLELASRDEVVTLDLYENYRNRFNILTFAKKLIAPTGLYDRSQAMRMDGNGSVEKMEFSYANIINRLTAPWSDWAILCRTNSEVDNFYIYCKQKNIPCLTFKQGDLTKEELDEKMQSNTVKILTIHSAKGLEWKNVIVTGIRASHMNLEEYSVAYVAATRARDQLIWTYYPKKAFKKSYNWGE